MSPGEKRKPIQGCVIEQGTVVGPPGLTPSRALEEARQSVRTVYCREGYLSTGSCPSPHCLRITPEV